MKFTSMIHYTLMCTRKQYLREILDIFNSVCQPTSTTVPVHKRTGSAIHARGDA